jgi:hypothetical protein
LTTSDVCRVFIQRAPVNTIEELTDVSFPAGVLNSEVLTFNGLTQQWENKAQGLLEHSDTLPQSLANEQYLKYDLASGKWINTLRASGAISVSSDLDLGQSVSLVDLNVYYDVVGAITNISYVGQLVDQPSSQKLRYTGTDSRTFRITCTLSVVSSNNDETHGFRIMHEDASGVDIAPIAPNFYSNAHANRRAHIHFTVHKRLNQNERVGLQIRNYDSNNRTIEIEGFSLEMTEI